MFRPPIDPCGGRPELVEGLTTINRLRLPATTLKATDPSGENAGPATLPADSAIPRSPPPTAIA